MKLYGTLISVVSILVLIWFESLKEYKFNCQSFELWCFQSYPAIEPGMGTTDMVQQSHFMVEKTAPEENCEVVKRVQVFPANVWLLPSVPHCKMEIIMFTYSATEEVEWADMCSVPRVVVGERKSRTDASPEIFSELQTWCEQNLDPLTSTLFSAWKATQDLSNSDVNTGKEQAFIYLSRSLQETHEASKWVSNSMRRLFPKDVTRLRASTRNHEGRGCQIKRSEGYYLE